MNLKKLFKRYNIRPLEVKLKIENFERFRKEPNKTAVDYTMQCKIILSSTETDEKMQEFQSRKNEESEHKLYLIIGCVNITF